LEIRFLLSVIEGNGVMVPWNRLPACILHHLVPVWCPGCKSSNQDAVALQCVVGLDGAVPALLKELVVCYLLLPCILIKILFFLRAFLFPSCCLGWKTAWRLASCMVKSQLTEKWKFMYYT